MFGKIIKELRTERKMSQEELARKLNVTQSTVGKYEREERDLSTELTIKICKLFKVSADYLLGLENEDGTKNY
ncbi:MAG: helix-turn-helix transcriptional regulator [Clostridia bacterium]|nr:helix-turn-helix transcriptional regulator [Clostridia bacterium]